MVVVKVVNRPSKTRVRKELSEIVRKTRKNNDMSLRLVAYKTGLSAAYISQLERGLIPTPTPETLRNIANALHLNYDLLMEKAGYVAKKDTSEDSMESIMFSDIDAFRALSDDEQERIINSLKDQADYLVNKASKANKED